MPLTRPLSVLFLGLSLLLAACATSPTGRSQLILVSDAEMAQMGAQAFDQLKQETPPTRDSRVSSYVNCVANALTPHVQGGYNWEVRVFEDDSVNAFALPGGKIGVNTGLLKAAQNQHQLAAVVGHEIAHVIARHSAARVSNQLATQVGVTAVAAGTGMDPQLIGMGADLLLTLPYSRADETEADVLGLDYMARAGFDPRESVTLWQNMAREAGPRPAAFMSTHPAPEARMRELQRRMPDALILYEEAQKAGRRPNCRP